MVQQMTLYMMTERVDPTQMGRLTTVVEGANKAVTDAMKTFKQMSDSLEKVKGEVAENKRKVNDLRAEIDALKRRKVEASKGRGVGQEEGQVWKKEEGQEKFQVLSRRESGHTMRGLTQGSVTVGERRNQGRVIVVGEFFPSWLLQCTNLGVNIEHVLLKYTKLQAVVYTLCGNSTRVWCGLDWCKIIAAWPRLSKGVVCLLEGRVTSELLDIMASLGIEDIVSTQRPRRVIPGWKFIYVAVKHCDVGGITEGVTTIVRHSRMSFSELPEKLEQSVPRDATTVLSQAVFGQRFRARPAEIIVTPLRAWNLGTISLPFFHGAGWLPAVINRSTWVLTPVINSSQHGGRWGLRELTGGEILLAKDASVDHTKLLASAHGDDSFLMAVIPGKSLVAGSRALFNGGGIFKDVENRVRLVEVLKPQATREREVTSSKIVVPSRSVVNPLGQIETSFVEKTEKVDPDFDEIANNKAYGQDLEAISREKRERSAAKADDAEIPEYLWFEHLVADGLTWAWDEATLSRIRKVSNWFRERMLVWWKSNVRRTFLNWIKTKHRKLECTSDNSRRDSVVIYKPDCRSKADMSKPGYVWEEGTSSGLEEYKRWWLVRFGLCHRDLIVGRDAVARAARATWWNWDDGSRPFHWRWPDEYRDRIRDGIPVYFIAPMKPYRVAQVDKKDPSMKAQLMEKLQKARDRRYIAPGHVVSLTAFFGVKKSETDVRPVYDGSVSGLNDSIWMPRFVLPTIQTHLRQVEAGTYMCDLDVGEMFLNFVLHESIRALTGVDLTHYVESSPGSGPVWECWQRAAMGLTSSPYQACQGMGFAEELIRGNHQDSSNIFRWDRVRLNLPGAKEYDPTKPWVSKIRNEDGHIAVDFCTFVDDARPTGPTKREAWLAARKIGSFFSRLGLQDAPRKRRDSSQRPGAWTGSVLRTDEGQVRLLISEDKWVKTKGLLAELRDMIERSPKEMPRKRLEQIRGYLVHIAQTYPMFSSYLIGLHMTIDFWRPNRDHDGWRFATAYVLGMKAGGDWPDDYDSAKGPRTVEAVPRLSCDVKALEILTGGPLPLLRRV